MDLCSESPRGDPLTVWLDEAEIRPGRSIRGAVDAGRDSSTLTPRADSGEPRAQQMSVGHRAVDEPLEFPREFSAFCVGLSTSRPSRSKLRMTVPASLDFHIFLETARETGTLISTNGVVCDPSS